VLFICNIKCRGSLTNSSPVVIEICVVTEKIFRSYEKDAKRKNALSILCLKTLKNIKSDIFSSKDYFDHILEQTYLEDH